MLRSVFAIIVVVCTARPALAAFAFDQVHTTLAPGNSFTSWIGYAVYGPNSFAGTQSAAAKFTAPAGFTHMVYQVELAMNGATGLDAFTASIAPDVAGEPGAPLESVTVHDELIPIGSVISVAFAGTTALNGNQAYWVTLEALPGSDTEASWLYPDPFQQGTTAWWSASGWNPTPSSELPGYRVSGFSIPIPEPATIVLLGLAGLSLLARHHACSSSSLR